MSIKDYNLNCVITNLLNLTEYTIENIASLDNEVLARVIDCYTRYYLINRIPYKIDYVRSDKNY